MKRLTLVGIVLAMGLSVGWPASAFAVDDARKCESFKLKHTGTHAFCQMKAQSKFAKTLDGGKLSTDLGKCDSKIVSKFVTADSKWGGSCPAGTGDVGTMRDAVTQCTEEWAALLSGGSLPAECGNGVVEGSEECEFGNLNGETCETQGMYNDVVAGTGLGCTPGTCQFDTSGCDPSRYNVDAPHGTRTVIDNTTGLQWEKKRFSVGSPNYCTSLSDCPEPRDVDNVYTWTNDTVEPTGTVFTNFLGRLNGAYEAYETDPSGCFAGHCDWRVPTREELETILIEPFPCGTVPCIDPIFGPTQSNVYWSATTGQVFPTYAWFVYFLGGYVDGLNKTRTYYVRGVRGGL